MKLSKIKPILVILILLATISAFIYYFRSHPEVRHQLGLVPHVTLFALIGLYLGMVATTGLILLATLKLCNLNIQTREGLLVTMYSSIINFFGPLQSGPAFRAVYLKQKHGLKIKHYALATLLYYALFAGFSGMFLLSGVLGKWLFLGLVAAAIAIVWLAYSKMNLATRLRTLNLHQFGFLAIATLLQVCLVAIIYMVEIHSVDRSVSFGQAIIYTGAANFALFVSLTPGAIGFREAFLVFSEKLHHISYSTIVSANVLDRTVYIAMLLVLVAVIFGTHAQKRFKIDRSLEQ